ncbi:MAG: HAMP domain-containing sensor histidine kinase [Chitinophagaceae bacterium]
MPDVTKKKLARATWLYWMLLIYIVAALVWWFISLEKQNDQMKEFKVRQLNATIDSTISPGLYSTENSKIEREYKRNRTKFFSEGSVFLLLIAIGAALVYRSVRRQFRVQQQQQNFMMAVTHELKTPISVVKLNLETLQKYSLEPQKQKRLIHTTLEETGRLNFLTNNILISSQLEGGYTFSKEELNLSSLLDDSIQDFKTRFSERTFTTDIEPDADIKGDPMLLQMLINNLVENAIKYSPKESPVKASLKKDDAVVRLCISDQGTGIPDEEKKKIFDKFYRIGNEATRKTQGTGLGLYLCSKIAADHNADISVTNNNPSGSTFVVRFYT